MHYYIDGYNFFFYLIKQINPLRQKREQLAKDLSHEIQHAGLNTTIIFDARHDQSLEFPTKSQENSLEIIFTPSGLSADDYIIELLSFHKNLKIEVVVTSDRFLAKRVLSLGAKIIKIEDFLRLLVEQKHKKSKHLVDIKHPISMTDTEFSRFLEVFHRNLSKSELEDL